MRQSSLQFKTSLMNKAHETLLLELKTSKSIRAKLIRANVKKGNTIDGVLFLTDLVDKKLDFRLQSRILLEIPIL
jgi:hypothetical protein